MDFFFVWGYGTIFGVIAFVYCTILVEPGMILSWWYVWLNKKIGYARNTENTSELSEPIKWLWKPIIECVYCVGGQMMLWAYLIFKWDNYYWFEHLAVIFVTIFTVDAIQRLWEMTKQITKRKRKVRR